MRKTTLLTTLTISLISLIGSIPPALAQSADTPVASSAAIKEDINKRIKEAIDKNLKNTEDILGDNANRNLLVGYLGTITDIKQGVFNLNTDESVLQISYDAKTAILKDGKPLKPELISLRDQAIAIGNLSSPDILSAKRIVISQEDATPKPEKKVILGAVVKIKGTTLTLKIDDKNLDVTLGKKLKLDLKALTPNNKIFGILLYNTNQTVTLIQAKVL